MSLFLQFRIAARHLVGRSWHLTKVFYWWFGIPLEGRPDDEVWYFSFGSNMHDSAFRERRKMRPLEWRAGRITGYRLRFNLEGRPKGRAAPANIEQSAKSEVWGVLYRITRKDLIWLEATEGVGRGRYRPLWTEATDKGGIRLPCVTYIAKGEDADGRPSLRYITLLRDGARAHELPQEWIAFLDKIEPAE